MTLTWLWKMEDALLHVLGPAQISTVHDEERVRAERAEDQTAQTRPATELLTGGWVRRGRPGSYYIVRTADAQRH